MDNHPIPQDVTGFQFRLIGNMTVKQFAYIAVGAVSAVILFYLPIFILIKIVLIPLFILGGVALAFVPVEGRPVDIMAANFLKALFAPNQYLYHRTGGQLLLSTIHISPKIAGQTANQAGTAAAHTNTSTEREQARQQQLAAYLQSLQQNQPADEKEAARMSALFGNDAAAPTLAPAGTTSTPAATPVPPPPQPHPDPLLKGEGKEGQPPEASLAKGGDEGEKAPDAETAVLIQKDTEKIAEDEALITQMNDELTRAKAQAQPVGATPNATPPIDPGKVSEIERKLQEIMAAKEQLEQELQSLKQSPTAKVVSTPTVPSVPGAQPAEPQATPTPVVTAPKAPPAKGSFPSLPDAPNILLGTVRDSSGNVLPNILVEVTDSTGSPVRAFKTNQLGQFMSATPLKAGSYTLTFEDAKNQYKFDPTPVNVNDQIMQPLEIAAHDAREELRKALFA